MGTMELADYVKPWGEKARLARAMACDSQLVGQWADGQRPVPVNRRPHIERHTAGKVTCEEQGTDATWVRSAAAHSLSGLVVRKPMRMYGKLGTGY